ncbi:hypothetical protein [Halalkalibacter urbisdiaboli]|uniref:hypothetical protein n=1 Tax=Halalkalibacter urbisdiaboli TaxID=1960589 RepID=UPI000B43ED98|nr:hypothetical protein [Halalkalibacter urbisdiaboli]
MALGINKKDLQQWKDKALRGEIAFLTHYWLDDRFPTCKTVTKVACADVRKLLAWGRAYGLKQEWLHNRHPFPHFDLLGEKQQDILKQEGIEIQLERLINKH